MINDSFMRKVYPRFGVKRAFVRAVSGVRQGKKYSSVQPLFCSGGGLRRSDAPARGSPNIRATAVMAAVFSGPSGSFSASRSFIWQYTIARAW